MKTLLRPLSVTVLPLALLGFSSAQEADHSRKQMEDYPVFVGTDVLMGCPVQGPDGREDKVKDALLDASTGCILGLVMESGRFTVYDDVRWDAENKRFAAAANRGRSSGDTPGRGHDHDLSLDDAFLLSGIVQYPLMGYSRGDEGILKDERLGSIGGAFVDTQSGHLAYVTTSVGGVLGIGAESRVIPWAAVRVGQNEKGRFVLSSSIMESRLKKAPKYGDGPDNLHNPKYRDSLYAYYGTRRADFEPWSLDETPLVPVDEMMGATLAYGGKDREGKLRDFIVDPKTGQAVWAVCETGKIVPVSALAWKAKERHFTVSDDATQREQPTRDGMVLASALAGASVTCGDKWFGDVEDVYFDPAARELAYLSFHHDGVRVLPWSVAALNVSDEEPLIRLTCNASAVRSAPELDGQVGASIYSPAFRKRVDELVTLSD